MFSPGKGYPLETTISTTGPTNLPRLSSSSTSLSSGAITSIIIRGIATIAFISILYLIYK